MSDALENIGNILRNNEKATLLCGDIDSPASNIDKDPYELSVTSEPSVPPHPTTGF